MPSGLGFFLLPVKSQGSRLSVAIGIKWHCKKLLVSFLYGGLGIFSPLFCLYQIHIGNVSQSSQFKMCFFSTCFTTRVDDRTLLDLREKAYLVYYSLRLSAFFFPSPPKVNDILLFKHCFLGFIDPLRASLSPLLPGLGEAAIVHKDFLRTAPPPVIPLFSHYKHDNCSSYIFQV